MEVLLRDKWQRSDEEGVESLHHHCQLFYLLRGFGGRTSCYLHREQLQAASCPRFAHHVSNQLRGLFSAFSRQNVFSKET